MSRTALLVATLAVTAICGAIAVAEDGTKRVGARVTLAFELGGDEYSQYPTDTFRGRVKSARRCRRGRKVEVRGAGSRVGTDRTNSRGRFRIAAPTLDAGEYVARVKRKRTESRDGDPIVCKRSRSKRVDVSQQ